MTSPKQHLDIVDLDAAINGISSSINPDDRCKEINTITSDWFTLVVGPRTGVNAITFILNCIKELEAYPGRNADMDAIVLSMLKASWNNLWTITDSVGRQLVVDFVNSLCKEYKTYDELNGVTTALELIESQGKMTPEEISEIRDNLNIEITSDVSPDGHSFQANRISMKDVSKNRPFHKACVEFMNSLTKIQGSTVKVNETGAHTVFITDPEADPFFDDHTCIATFLGIDLHHSLTRKITILVTGCAKSLDARRRGIEFVKKKHPDIDIVCCPVSGDGFEDGGRFLSPYGAAGAETAYQEDMMKTGSEYQAEILRTHLADCIPEDVTHVIDIGQKPTDFASKIVQRMQEKDNNLSNLESWSKQGPGFNDFQTSPEEMDEFVRTLQSNGVKVYWSDNKSGLKITPPEVTERFKVLAKLNPDIPVNRRDTVVNFVWTSGLPRHFQGQYDGFLYSRDAKNLLLQLVEGGYIVDVD